MNDNFHPDALLDLLEATITTGAVVPVATDDNAIACCNTELIQIGLPPLPDDLAVFLKVVDGYGWNGFEFFGTQPTVDGHSGYVLQDIVTHNVEIREGWDFSDTLLIVGRFDEDIYVYNQTEQSYQALDSLTQIEIDTYHTFWELFSDMVFPYLPDERRM